MAIFCGCYELAASPDPAAGHPAAELVRLLSEAGAGNIQQRRRGRLFVAWFDNGAYPDSGIFEDPDTLCILAGDPLYARAPGARSRQAAALAAAGNRLAAELAHCTGSFALLFHSLREESLVLATDPVGVRPVYVGQHGGRLYFSSCLSVLEQLDCLPLTVLASALLERLALRFNLDGRTPYREIRVLRQGEMLAASRAGISTQFYHSWEHLPPVEMEYPRRVRRIYELFRQAVERRCWRSADSIVMLSGGLDSRMNAGVLHQLGKRILAINCSPPGGGFQDEAYATKVAAAIGCDLVRVPLPPGPVMWGQLASEGLRRLPRNVDPAGSRLVFSGDGGSVGLGLVYYDPDTPSLLRAGRHADVIEAYLARHSLRIPDRYLQRRAQTRAALRLRETILSLTAGLRVEPGRQFHLFLMHNDQRTHLHDYFERIAIYGHEPVLPFFDADLLRFALSCPVDDFVGHKLYHDLISYLPEPLSRIPWQTYPGHLPCPVAEAEEGCSQFSDAGRRKLASKRSPSPWEVLRLALGRRSPSPPFRRLTLLATAAAAVPGWRRFEYVHSAAHSAARFLDAARGRFEWDL